MPGSTIHTLPKLFYLHAGYLFEPPSRQRLANEAGLVRAFRLCAKTTPCSSTLCTLVGLLFVPSTRSASRLDQLFVALGPHCTLASPMVSEAQGAPSRPYPGSRAFADPGTASSAGFLYNGNSPFGVCGESHTEGTRDGLPCGGLGSAGTQQLGTNDYNYPGGRTDSKTGLLTWGEKFTEVQAGAVLDVSWCTYCIIHCPSHSTRPFRCECGYVESHLVKPVMNQSTDTIYRVLP